MNELLVIEGVEIEKVEYQGQPVLSLPSVDRGHQRPEGTARRNFNQNRDRFAEGVDFFELGYEIWTALIGRNTSLSVRNSSGRKEVRGGRRGSMIFLTMKGYLKLAKSFTDDLAWRVQDILVDSYFRLKDVLRAAEQSLELMQAKDELIDTQRRLIAAMEAGRRKRRPFTDDDRANIRAMADEGKSCTEIGHACGRNKSSIANLLYDWGFMTRKPRTA